MNKFDLPTDPALARRVISENAKVESTKVQLGYLGRFFGSGIHARVYIVALIAIMLLISAIIFTILPANWKTENFGTRDLWVLILPVLTTIVGYLIGTADRKAEP